MGCKEILANKKNENRGNPGTRGEVLAFVDNFQGRFVGLLNKHITYANVMVHGGGAVTGSATARDFSGEQSVWEAPKRVTGGVANVLKSFPNSEGNLEAFFSKSGYLLQFPVHPTPFTLQHPALNNLYLAHYTLHPTPYTLHPTPYTLNPDPTPYTLHSTPCTLHLTPDTLHP